MLFGLVRFSFATEAEDQDGVKGIMAIFKVFTVF
jgi:hypothetical protein